jgi:hypothetical protein
MEWEKMYLVASQKELEIELKKEIHGDWYTTQNVKIIG